jgi:hypothetical protein
VPGGLIAGAALGATSGFVLSRFVHPSGGQSAVVAGGSALGGGLGLGVAMLASARAAGAATPPPPWPARWRESPPPRSPRATPRSRPRTRPPCPSAPASGGLVGALAPSLGEDTWSGLGRRTGAGCWPAPPAARLAAVALRHATDAAPLTLGLTTLGGVDGLATGVGVGLLFDDGGGSQAERIGAVAGSLGGLGLGATPVAPARARALGPRLHRSRPLAGRRVERGVGARARPRRRRQRQQPEDGGAARVAGAGAGSFLATALVPHLEVDGDLIQNAVVLDALSPAPGRGGRARQHALRRARCGACWAGARPGSCWAARSTARSRSTPKDHPLLALIVGRGRVAGAVAAVPPA